MTADPTLVSAFRAVDLSPNPSEQLDYLEWVSELDFVRTYKRHSFELLGLQPGDRVLDVGCGTGDDVRALAELIGPSGQVVGVDSSEVMIAEARSRRADAGPTTDFRVGDAHRLPFSDDVFDCCRADRVLQHVEDPRQVLKEMARVARHGARVVVSEPDWETILIDASDREVTRRILNARCDRMRHGWIGRQLPRLFGEVGLQDIAVSPRTMVLHDLASAAALLDLDGSAERACASGLISTAEARAWLAELRVADATGRFFCAGSVFVVVGRRR